MASAPRQPLALTQLQARRIWLHAQRLDVAEPFGVGPAATSAAVSHLGYVQIDTINVIERCHHHILWTRIPGYHFGHLHQAQSIDKSVFEYWTHALSFVPTNDIRFYLPAMKQHRAAPAAWFNAVKPEDLRRVIELVREGGALSIRDIEDDVLVEKDHAWASRKPSKRALQLAFYNGTLAVSQRSGMLKTYELATRHFGWDQPPKPASQAQVLAYLLDRALRSQGLVSLNSVCHLAAGRKAAIRQLIGARVAKKQLLPAVIAGQTKTEFWIDPGVLENTPVPVGGLVHILSPFDPLIIQRQRLNQFFDYDHRFEAYVPPQKRVMGYFALPVLSGNEIIAAIDLKTDREKQVLRIQKWTWVGNGQAAEHKAAIEAALHRFERFQLARQARAQRRLVE